MNDHEQHHPEDHFDAQIDGEHTHETLENPDGTPDNFSSDVMGHVSAIRENLDQLGMAHDSQQQNHESTSRSLQDWEASLDLREEALQQREQSLRAQRSEFDTTRAELASMRNSIEETSHKLEDRLAHLQERESQSIENASKLEEALNDALTANQELEFSNGSLCERLESLESSLRDANETGTRFEALQNEHEQICNERDTLRAELESHTASIESLEARLEELQRIADEAQSGTERIDELERSLASSQEERDSLRQQNDASQEELGTLRQTIESLESTLSESSGSQEQLDALEQQLREVTSQRDTLEQQTQSLRGELEEAGSCDDEVERLASSLKSASEERDALASRIASLEEENSSLRESMENADSNPDTQALQSEIDRRDLVIEKLSAKLEDVESQREALKAQTSQQHTSADSQHAATRMMRLRKMKKLLQSEGKKLSVARKSIAQKHSEAQKVLEQRNSIAKERTSLREREAKILKMARRNSIARVAFMLAIAIGILGFGAWEVAKMVPARYLVNATVQARGPMAGDESELTAWREHMTAMLTNTRLIDTAAERMKRRGIEEYASAPRLSELVNNQIEFTFPSPDTIQFSLVGMGDLDTERVLETYLAVFVSVTNDAAASYGGSVSASITQAPQAEERPIDTERQLMLAGGIWGGVTFLVLGVSVWASRAFASATARLRKDNEDATKRAYSYDGISQLPEAA
ncbi:MAG: hypothetical protein ACF8GE_08835 [Phycisphaerales bacterium JB043]